MEKKKISSCFAYRRGTCKILNVNKCKGLGCSFFKTMEQYKKGKEEALKHIRSLDRGTQINIIDTYYGGKMSLLDKVEEE